MSDTPSPAAASPAPEADQTRLNALRAELATQRVAFRAGIIDPDDLRLIDFAALQPNAQGQYEGLEELIATLKREKPHLFQPDPAAPPARPPSAAASPTTRPTPPPRLAPSNTIDALAMSREEYAAHKAQVMAKKARVFRNF